MKTNILIILFSIGLSFSCKKEVTFMNNGTITGFDMRDCVCCGGLMINFRNEIKSYTGEFYLIDNNPSEFGINDKTKFPVQMMVNWVKDSMKCSNQHIKITKFKIH